MIFSTESELFICPLIGVRAIRVVLVSDMIDQDSVTDQSNRTEDTDQERIEYVERTDVDVRLQSNSSAGPALAIRTR